MRKRAPVWSVKDSTESSVKEILACSCSAPKPAFNAMASIVAASLPAMMPRLACNPQKRLTPSPVRLATSSWTSPRNSGSASKGAPRQPGSKCRSTDPCVQSSDPNSTAPAIQQVRAYSSDPMRHQARAARKIRKETREPLAHTCGTGLHPAAREEEVTLLQLLATRLSVAQTPRPTRGMARGRLGIPNRSVHKLVVG